MSGISGDPSAVGGGVTPTGPIGPTEEITAEQVLLNPTLLSTLSPSQLEEISTEFIAGLPFLSGGDFENFMDIFYDLDQAMLAKVVDNDAVSALLDNWVKSEQAKADRIHEELNSPAYQAYMEQKKADETQAYMITSIRSSTEFNEFIQSLPPDQLAKELNLNKIAAREEMRIGLVNAIDNYLDRARTDPNAVAAPIMFLGFIAAASMIPGITEVGATEVAGLNSIQTAWPSFAPVIPVDLQTTALLTINFFAAGTIYPATAETIKDAQAAGTKPANLEFALKNANAVAKQVMGNEINLYLMGMLGNKLGEADLDKLAAKTKVIMLAVALGLIYKAEAGWITKQEFNALLSGEMEPRHEEEAMLAGLLRQQLESLPEEDQEMLREALANYFGRNPSAEEMRQEDAFHPMKAFLGILEEVPYNEASTRD